MLSFPISLTRKLIAKDDVFSEDNNFISSIQHSLIFHVKARTIDRSVNIILFGELYTKTTQGFSQWADGGFSAKDPIETKLLSLITHERFSPDL